MAPLKPGWYSDPHGSKMLRWWDGSEWTGQLHEPVTPDGSDANDPVATSPQDPDPAIPKYGYFPDGPPSRATAPHDSSPAAPKYGHFPDGPPVDAATPPDGKKTAPESVDPPRPKFLASEGKAWSEPTRRSSDPAPNPFQRYWSALREHVWLRWVSGIAAFILVVAIAGSGSTEDSGPDSAAAGAGEKSVAVSIKSPIDNNTVDGATALIKGTATPGSRVSVVDGRSVLVGSTGTWAIAADLTSEENLIEVNAAKSGLESSSDAITVLRPLTPAEKRKLEAKRKAERRKLAAKRKAEKRRAAAAKRRAAARVRAKRAKARQTFINSAAAIPYKKLNKDPERYAGKKVTFRGQIFQIQESGDLGGFMLLSVTNEGYGFWDDNVWVNYDHSISAGEEDVITIYGRVVGSRDYETQIGGSTYVPEIDARYIVTK